MISNDALKIKLDGYPPELLRNYAAFVERRSPDDLSAFVIGLIRFLQDSNDPAGIPDFSDSTELRRDLGARFDHYSRSRLPPRGDTGNRD